tara:strand:- start:1457 stop:2146 length:690 start_codon:yes stop_codon:yes gene_type:complete
MNNQVSGTGNIAIGQKCLQQNSKSNNIAIGTGALQNNTTGYFNTAIGRSASIGNQTGYGNTSLGFQANQGVATGNYNTSIGAFATPSSNSTSGEFTLGNGTVSVLRCAVTSITSLSDERDKSEIKDLEFGLDFIDQLQPREFVWNHRLETYIDTDDDGNEIEIEHENLNKGKKDFGFIAQEVQQLDNDTLRLVHDENPEKIEMSYGKLVPILVKAIQDLHAEIKILKSK